MVVKRMTVEWKQAFGVAWGRDRVGRHMGFANFLDQTPAAGQKAIPCPVMVQVLAHLCDPLIALRAGAIAMKNPHRFSIARIPA
jgi:hypothetical protein